VKRNWIYLLILAIAVAEALATGNRIFFILVYLILAVWVISFVWSWINILGIEVRREVRSQRAQVGSLAEERIILQNKSRLPKLWVEVRDHSDLPGHRASHVVTHLEAGRQRGWTVRTYCRQRGRFTLGPITVRSGDPFGVYHRIRHVGNTQSLVVYPATIELPHFALPLGELPGGGARRQRTHYTTSNVAGVRDYAPGDSFNRIHWLSTARTGSLIAKEFELDPTADIWLFLDMHKDAHVDTRPPEQEEVDQVVPFWEARPTFELEPCTEEYAVTIAASLARHFLTRNRAVGLLAYGQRRELLQSDRGERQLNKILESLAVLRAHGSMPIAEILASEGTRFGRNTTVIVITSSSESSWVSALRGLSRRGIRGVAVVLDSASFGARWNVEGIFGELASSGIIAYRVRNGEPIADALSRGSLAMVIA
jgi:uncharacterized protein (DUF58 family)